MGPNNQPDPPEFEEDAEVEAGEPEAEGGEPEAEGGEPGAGEPEAEGEPAEAAPGRSRAQERIRALDARVKQEAERSTKLQEQVQELLRQQQAGQSAAQKTRDEEQLALMDPVEKRAFEAQRQSTEVQRQVQYLQFQMADGQDRSGYHVKAASNPVYGKYEAKVEEVLTEMRGKGMNAPRESVLMFLIGQDALKKSGSAQGSAQAGAQRTAAARGAPVSARGDSGAARSGKSDDMASLERRLAGVKF